MKKISALILYVLIISSAFASALYLAPMSGSFGVNLASEKYHLCTATTVDQIQNTSHVGTTLGNISGPNQYCDESMIAGGALTDARNKTIRISLSCPSGFSFVSQSNPAFVRPFAIVLIIKQANSRGDSGSTEIISREYIDARTSRTIEVKPTNNAVWFDAVLVLPGSLSGDGNSIDIDRKLYPLVDANDYIANVTISISCEDANPSELAISVPFSGYFDSDNRDGDKRDQAMNISIHTTGAASNLDIASLAASQLPVQVAEIETYYFLGGNIASLNAAMFPRMFLSASNNPYTSERDGFELLHTSVGYDTLHSSYNSIGYEVSTESYEKPSEDGGFIFDMIENGIDTADKPNKLVFKGDEYVEGENLVHTNMSADFIYPRLYNTEAYPVADSGQSFNYYYFYWKNPVYVKIDPIIAGTYMYPGVYEDTIYFHVIYE